ncbi:MAG: DUF4864 domain-containing protein [Planktotalea sp.]|uniref:DUF4864 domain-containing protein n=1 Tax=Planktotalea sp. TaxID=2029877 RepID=UPI003C755831
MFTRFSMLLAVVATLLASGVAVADDAAKPAITNTIQSQLSALQKDDFEQAFTYASPMIKRMFGSPANFGAMVSQGYPMVHRPSDVRFLELREVAGALYQKVQVRDASGRIHFLDYQMIEIENGWKINGVQLLKTSELSA